MYENYGGKRPEIPEGWEEVGYRKPQNNDIFISIYGPLQIWRGDEHEDECLIVRRKPVIDPALVAPAGYQFRLDEYGRPVCRAARAGEWYLCGSGAQPAGCNHYSYDPRYILDPIPEPPKMTIVEAAKAINGTPKGIRRRVWTNQNYSIRNLSEAFVSPNDILADDWEVVP